MVCNITLDDKFCMTAFKSDLILKKYRLQVEGIYEMAECLGLFRTKSTHGM
jgi:hypothetical protein